MKQYDKLAQRKARHHNDRRYWDLDEALYDLARVHHERIGSNHRASWREVDKLVTLMRSTYKKAARAAGLTVNHYDAKIYALRAVFMHYCKLLGLTVLQCTDEFGAPVFTIDGYEVVDHMTLDYPLADAGLIPDFR